MFTFFLIFRGTKKIVKFSEAIVPIMSVGYMVVTITIILCNVSELPSIIKTIIIEAFYIKSIIRGGLGSCIYS